MLSRGHHLCEDKAWYVWGMMDAFLHVIESCEHRVETVGGEVEFHYREMCVKPQARLCWKKR